MWDDGCHSVAVFYTAFRLCKTKEARCVLGVVFCWQISHKALRAVFTVHSVCGTSWWRLVITAARQLGTISSLNLPSVQSVQWVIAVDTMLAPRKFTHIPRSRQGGHDKPAMHCISPNIPVGPYNPLTYTRYCIFDTKFGIVFLAQHRLSHNSFI